MTFDKEIDSLTKLRCQRCFHEWPYSGKNPYFTLCPHCRTTVRVRKNKVESLQSAQVGSPVQTTTVATTTIPGDGIPGEGKSST